MHFNRFSSMWRCGFIVVAMAACTQGAMSQQGYFSFPSAAQTQIQLPTGSFPSHIEPVDLNGDGNLDLVVSARNNEGIAFIIPGAAGGTFSTPIQLQLSGPSDWVAAADLNGNGHLDLAFAIRASRGRIEVLFNDGEGSFPGPSHIYRVGRLTQVVVAEDVDGDGHIDLISANNNSGTIRILRNLGDGTFHIEAPILVGEYAPGTIGAGHVVAADLTGDGKPDFVTTTAGLARASVLRNIGGQLQRGADYKTPSFNGEAGGALMSALADMNGDGVLDLIQPMAMLFNTQRLAVFPGAGGDEARMLPAQTFTALGAGFLWTVTTADLDGDGRPEAIMGHAIQGHLSIMRNLTTPEDGLAFAEPHAFFNIGSFIRTVVPVDVNGNGAIDLIVVDYPAHLIRIMRNQTPQGGVAGSSGNPPEKEYRAEIAPRGAKPTFTPDAIREQLGMSANESLTAASVLERLANMGAPIIEEREGFVSPLAGEVPSSCNPLSGDCYQANGTPGCNDSECCQTVCLERPYCCTTDWDAICVQMAKEMCEVPPPPCPGKFSCFIGHDEIGCDDVECCELICLLDGFCCSIAWDEQCAIQAALLCGTSSCTIESPGGTPEAEECGQRLNDGCLAFEQDFINAVCGGMYRGQVFSGGPRDSDWYRVTIAQERRLTWTVTSEFPSQLLILAGTCAHELEVIARGFGGQCGPTPISVCVDPGTYYFYVAPGTSVGGLRVGVPCPDDESKEPPPVVWGNEYVAQITCDACPPPCVPADLNCDGVVDVLDLLILLGAWGPNPGHPADLNNSGTVDVQDLLILLAGWGTP
ncbi:MAG TPA: VCBS repeat-containing protein [Phycisphaerales bacterium]|nr:VCBS repeat-containing protein [Phycisphaerales bacterium]